MDKADTGVLQGAGETAPGVDHRTFPQRCSDAVTEFCGSWAFVIWSTIFVFGWMGINTYWLLFRRIFDPYPFIALNLVLTVVSTLQGPLIMMSQNRQADRDREAVQQIRQMLESLGATGLTDCRASAEKPVSALPQGK